MRTFELTMTAAVILGCIFKIMHWPWASALIVLGGNGLALFYFPFGFRTLPAPKPTDQVLWMTLLGGASLSVTLYGHVAFLQRWPNNPQLLVAGAIGCAISLLVGSVLRYRHPRLDIYFDGLLIRCLVLGLLAITLWQLFSGKPR
ncbi:MAG: hypothetical protein JST66_13750 [Bacteroidetes bacterium]|nr:hypothetical protein [Bacteroidota bacterium]